MTQNWKALIAGVALVGGSGLSLQPVQAQGTGMVPIRAKIGIFRPESSATRAFSGSTNFMGEVDVAIPSLGAGSTLVSAGYAQGSRNGGKLRVIPLTVTKLFSPPNPAAGVTGNVYFGLGAGPYFVKATAGGASQSKTRIGGFGVVGYQFPNPFFVEAKYHVVSKVAGLSPGGLALMVGRRF